MRLHERVEKPTPKVEFPTASEGATAAQIANAAACTRGMQTHPPGWSFRERF